MSRELLSKALAELDNADSFGVPGLKPLIDEIQDELAKPDEPVAWECTRGGFVELTIVHPSQVWGNGNKNIKPLYTHPPAQQKPLSDDEVRIIINSTFRTDTGWIEDFMILVRSVEQAHGIK